MMQGWNRDAVRFMRDASEYGSHYELLADELMRWLPRDGHVCDAGCGLGYLSQALARRCRRVTAVDRSEAAISALKERNPAKNIDIHCADVFQLRPEPPYDAMTFCYFGRTQEVLRTAKRQCSGPVVMVKRDCNEHRFSVLQKTQIHRDVRTAAEELLQNLGIPFQSERLELEFGQPFRSFEDALAFYRLYNPDREISPQWVSERLTRTGRSDFPLYLPETRRMAILVFETKNIPPEESLK